MFFTATARYTLMAQITKYVNDAIATVMSQVDKVIDRNNKGIESRMRLLLRNEIEKSETRTRDRILSVSQNLMKEISSVGMEDISKKTDTQLPSTSILGESVRITQGDSKVWILQKVVAYGQSSTTMIKIGDQGQPEEVTVVSTFFIDEDGKKVSVYPEIDIPTGIEILN